MSHEAVMRSIELQGTKVIAAIPLFHDSVAF